MVQLFKKLNLGLLLVAYITSACSSIDRDAAGAGLVVLSIDEPARGGGKPLQASFRETERAADYSVFEARYGSGAAVPYSLFIVKGECAIMQARHQAYSLSKKQSMQPEIYRMTFPQAPSWEDVDGPKKEVLSSRDCRLLGF